MIAYDESAETPARPRLSGSRAGRNAAQTRRARTARLRRRALGMLLGFLVPTTFVVVGYLALMANLTRMGYQLDKLDLRHATLAARAARLEDRIGQLASRDRLATVAARLGLQPAETLTVATLPPPVRPEHPRGLAFLPFATGWLR